MSNKIITIVGAAIAASLFSLVGYEAIQANKNYSTCEKAGGTYLVKEDICLAKNIVIKPK